jgi:hypothetical protein
VAKLETGRPKTGGRKKGTPNKTTALLKDAILEAAGNAGEDQGLVGYLTSQAHFKPRPVYGASWQGAANAGDG